MSGFGENLRREREARGVSLEDISAVTKISVRLLQAIEDEEFDRLPGGIFNTNFVRQYARYLGLDDDKVVTEYRRLVTPPSGVAGGNEDDAPPERPRPHGPPGPVEWMIEKAPEYEWGRLGQRRVWTLAKWVVAAAALGITFYIWWTGRRAARTEVPTPAAAVAPAGPAQGAPTSSSAAAPATTVEAPPPRSKPEEVAPKPAEATPAPPTVSKPEPAATGPPAPSTNAAGAATAPAPVAAEAPVRVEIQAKDAVWISAIADGKLRVRRRLRAQQTRLITARSEVRLVVGDAAALTVKLNGEVQPSLGPKNQVRTAILTPQGMRVEEPPPTAEPSPPPEPKPPDPLVP